MKVKSLRHTVSILSLTVAYGTLLTGCDSFIYDEQGDCSVHYNVPVTFTETIDGGDALYKQVKGITLYVIDNNGNVVTTQTASGSEVASPGFSMQVDVAPGNYNLLVWATGESSVENPVSFNIGQGNDTSQLSATLPLKGSDGSFYCNQDIVPLFHGLTNNVEFPDTYGNITVAPVNLTKDTHVFQVLLQSVDGLEIDPEEFTFRIEADNSELSYTNTVISDRTFDYLPWQISMTSASVDRPNGLYSSRAEGDINGLLAELTTSRLMAGSTPMLAIRRTSDNTDIIRINLIEYLLMVKGEYNRLLSNQQYLDRMGLFTIMFLLDVDRNWYASGGVFINGWRVVPPYQGSL